VGATPPLRQLWQVPTFVLGLLALAAVCLVRPPWHGARASEDDPASAELRELLRQPEFDRDRALKLGADAVHRAGTPPAGAEAHFLLGSAYLRVAERAGPGKGHDEWREARAHLEQARALGVAAEESPRLEYRLAKTWVQTGEGPAKVIPALEHSIEGGADDDLEKARGYGLIADAYLKLPKPDLVRALEATVRQIDTAVVEDRVLGPARLRRGELLLRLGKEDDAAEVLKNVGAKAPPEVLAQARRLRVGILEHQGQWADAGPVWREILDDRRSPPPDRGVALYHLGLCLGNSGRKDEALAPWVDCLNRDGAGEEVTAAALGVADLRLQAQGDSQYKLGLTALERAMRAVNGPDDWHNSLVPLSRVREVFEAGYKAAAAKGASVEAVRLAQLYEKVALPGRAHELRGEAATAGARAAREKARRAAGEEARVLFGEAEDLLRQAGEAYELAAAAQADPAEHAERLWSAANRFLEGRDAKQAITALNRFLTIALQPDMVAVKRFNPRLNEGWYKLALAYKDTGDLKHAAENFEAAANRLEWASPYTYRARYELAAAAKQAGDPDGAQGYLEDNLNKLRTAAADRDDEAREKTLYALGDLYFGRRGLPDSISKDFISKAIDTLEAALRDFPNNPQALWARYQLAESYKDRAHQRTTDLSPEQLSMDARLENEKKVSDDREKAIASYQEVSRSLDAKPDRRAAEERLLVYVLLEAAEVRYLAGGYEKSAEMFEIVVERIKDKEGFEVQYFNALVNLVRGYSIAMTTYLGTESDYKAKMRTARQKVQRVVPEIRAGLPRLDPPTRKPFEEWLKAFDQSAPAGGVR